MYQSNEQLSLAEQYLIYTNKHVFLTGKAGTGKTTFLRNLQKNCSKRMAIAAPTGVAAINAAGVTIHSLFQLPFGPLVPGQLGQGSQQRRFSGEKIDTLRGIDLLVIDEISMVRADLLDGIDQVLRRFRDFTKPFGGVQLLMIGDLHQLAPVVKDEEWQLIQNYYTSPFFFESIALRQSQFVTIELTQIFRQQDHTFINLLNKVRNNALDAESIALLNSRYIPNFVPPDGDEYITLTTHNYSALQINNSKLGELSTKSYTFKAEITGDFPEHIYPNDAQLELKEGAQVMFVKNDSSREKRYFNGKIGVITKIENNQIKVKSNTDTDEISVGREIWNNIKYNLSEAKQIEEDVIGSFEQYPLKTAWAITIHKSQGLTFERAIIDAQASFAHGQVYVALSRCKTFDGMVLSSSIQQHSIKNDGSINAFDTKARSQAPSPETLAIAKRETQQLLIQELFDFQKVKKNINQLAQAIKAVDNHLPKQSLVQVLAIKQYFEAEIEEVASKFLVQLPRYFEAEILPEQQPELQQRIAKGSVFFIEKLQESVFEQLKTIEIEADNNEIKKSLLKSQLPCLLAVYEKIACLRASTGAFETTKYLQAKANAAIDFEKDKKQKAPNPVSSHSNANLGLYERIKLWRNQKADELDTDQYMVLPVKAMQSLAELRPANKASLAKVSGIGKVKLEQYGDEILEIIKSYCAENGLEPSIANEPEPAPKRNSAAGETFQISLKMYQDGLSVEDIAKTRGLSVGTVEVHIARFIEQGLVSVTDFVKKETLKLVSDYVSQNPESTNTAIKEHFGDALSWGQLRMIVASLKEQ
jgi:hypothetical protein